MTNFNVNKEQFQTINESLDYIDKQENPYSFSELPKMLQPGQGNMQQVKNNENISDEELQLAQQFTNYQSRVVIQCVTDNALNINIDNYQRHKRRRNPDARIKKIKKTRNKLKEKIANQYFTIRVKSDKEQSERRTIIQRRKEQEELYKRENVEKLKHQWHQDIIQAKIKFQRQKYKQIQEKRGQDLMYYFEASQDTKKKDLKKFNLNDSKIAQLYSISRDKYLQSGKTFKEQGSGSPGIKNKQQQQIYDFNFKDQMSKKVYQAQIELNHEETILNKKKIEQLRQLEEQMRLKIEEKKRVQQEIMFQRNNQSSVLSQNTSVIQKQVTKSNQNDNFSMQDINFDQKIYQDMNSSILKSQNKSTSNRYNTDSIGQINSQESRNKTNNKFEEFTYEDENEQESDDNKQAQDRLQNEVKKLNQDSEEEEYEDDDYEEQDDQFEDDDKQSIKPQQAQQIQQTSLEEPSFNSSVGNNNSNFLVIQHNPGNSNSQSTDQNSHKKSSFNIVNYKKNNEKDRMIKDTQHIKINQSMGKNKQQPEQNNVQHQKKVQKFVNKDIQSSFQMPAKVNLKIEQAKNTFTSKDKNEVKRQIQSIDIQNKEQIEQSSQNYDDDSSFQREQIPQQVKTDSQAISQDNLMSNDNDLDSDRDSNDDDLQEEDSDQDYSIDDDQFYKENSDDHQSNNTVLQSTSQHILKSKNAHKASVESNLTKTNQEGKEKGKTGIIIKHISKLDDHDE
eukprot:403345485